MLYGLTCKYGFLTKLPDQFYITGRTQIGNVEFVISNLLNMGGVVFGNCNVDGAVVDYVNAIPFVCRALYAGRGLGCDCAGIVVVR